MRIMSTDDLPIELIESFRSELPEEFSVELTEGRIALCSVEPPSWISLIANAEWWQQSLLAYSALYLAEIVKEAGKETWKSRAKAISILVTGKNNIRKMALAIWRFKSKLPRRTQIYASLPEPNQFLGSRLLISGKDTGLIELEIALFVHHLPHVSALVERHKAENTRPVSGYFLKILGNGDLQVEWCDAGSLENYSSIMSLNESVARRSE